MSFTPACHFTSGNIWRPERVAWSARHLTFIQTPFSCFPLSFIPLSNCLSPFQATSRAYWPLPWLFMGHMNYPPNSPWSVRTGTLKTQSENALPTFHCPPCHLHWSHPHIEIFINPSEPVSENPNSLSSKVWPHFGFSDASTLKLPPWSSSEPLYQQQVPASQNHCIPLLPLYLFSCDFLNSNFVSFYFSPLNILAIVPGLSWLSPPLRNLSHFLLLLESFRIDLRNPLTFYPLLLLCSHGILFTFFHASIASMTYFCVLQN